MPLIEGRIPSLPTDPPMISGTRGVPVAILSCMNCFYTVSFSWKFVLAAEGIDVT